MKFGFSVKVWYEAFVVC